MPALGESKAVSFDDAWQALQENDPQDQKSIASLQAVWGEASWLLGSMRTTWAVLMANQAHQLKKNRGGCIDSLYGLVEASKLDQPSQHAKFAASNAMTVLHLLHVDFKKKHNQCPDFFKGVSIPHAWLNHADLEGIDFSGSDLSQCTMINVKAHDTQFHETQMHGVQSNTYVVHQLTDGFRLIACNGKYLAVSEGNKLTVYRINSDPVASPGDLYSQCASSELKETINFIGLMPEDDGLAVASGLGSYVFQVVEDKWCLQFFNDSYRDRVSSISFSIDGDAMLVCCGHDIFQYKRNQETKEWTSCLGMMGKHRDDDAKIIYAVYSAGGGSIFYYKKGGALGRVDSDGSNQERLLGFSDDQFDSSRLLNEMGFPELAKAPLIGGCSRLKPVEVVDKPTVPKKRLFKKTPPTKRASFETKNASKDSGSWWRSGKWSPALNRKTGKKSDGPASEQLSQSPPRRRAKHPTAVFERTQIDGPIPIICLDPETEVVTPDSQCNLM